MASGSKGNCYICGAELGKAAMKNHILKAHDCDEEGQLCSLLKIEGAYQKDYWLLVDIPVDKSLSDLDRFLRKIWLECCGHMSEFLGGNHSNIAKSRKLGAISVGSKLWHAYDFGSTTETLITVMGTTKRRPQRAAVRLLARNVPPEFPCAECGKPADFLCAECMYDSDNPFYCHACGDEHEHDDMLLPVTNSPRMGVCGYEGALDTFAFDPQKIGGDKGK